MKKLLYFAAIVASVVACTPTNQPDNNGEYVPSGPTKAFTFHVKGAFQTNYEEMTRAGVRLEENNTD